MLYNDKYLEFLKEFIELSKHNDAARELIQSIYREYNEMQKDRPASAKA